MHRNIQVFIDNISKNWTNNKYKTNWGLVITAKILNDLLEILRFGGEISIWIERTIELHSDTGLPLSWKNNTPRPVSKMFVNFSSPKSQNFLKKCRSIDSFLLSSTPNQFDGYSSSFLNLTQFNSRLYGMATRTKTKLHTSPVASKIIYYYSY